MPGKGILQNAFCFQVILSGQNLLQKIFWKMPFAIMQKDFVRKDSKMKNIKTRILEKEK